MTNDKIAFLVATVWPNSFTPSNIMGGFRKTGIYPICNYLITYTAEIIVICVFFLIKNVVNSNDQAFLCNDRRGTYLATTFR